MDDLERGMVTLRDGLVPAWDAERSARVFAGVGQLRRRRAVQRAGFAAAGAAVLAVAVFAAVPRGAAPEVATRAPAAARVAVPQVPAQKPTAVAVATPAPVPADAEGTLRLADGSLVESIDGAADLRVVRDEPARVEIALVAGHARFDVTHRPARSFEVTAGAWRVLVVGTRFDVRQVEGGVRVSVERGLVRVLGPGAQRELAAGESASFVAPAPALVSAHARSRATAAPRVEATPDWRQLIQRGDHDGAYHMLAAGARVDDDPWSLMDAADAARLSGHPDGAVAYLDRVVRNHGTSPVAPLAAFTLGRIDLDRLGRPHDAAEAFAAARTLAPGGSLAQDALAREVEAWSKAGDVEQAYRRAQEYVTTYPDGRRLTAVRRYGGLEKIE